MQKTGDAGFLESVAELTLERLMAFEVEGLCGAAKHEHSDSRINDRNGDFARVLDTRVGTLALKIPELRQGTDFPPFLGPRKMSERALAAAVRVRGSEQKPPLDTFAPSYTARRESAAPRPMARSHSTIRERVEARLTNGESGAGSRRRTRSGLASVRASTSPCAHPSGGVTKGRPLRSPPTPVSEWPGVTATGRLTRVMQQT